MRAATDTTAMIDLLAIAFSLPNTLLNLGKPGSFLRNESSRSGLNLGSVAASSRGRRVSGSDEPGDENDGHRARRAARFRRSPIHGTRVGSHLEGHFGGSSKG